MLLTAISSLGAVVGVLWKKVENQQTQILEQYKETKADLKECQEDRLALHSHLANLEKAITTIEQKRGT